MIDMGDGRENHSQVVPLLCETPKVDMATNRMYIDMCHY